jgi:hypothetical protein
LNVYGDKIVSEVFAGDSGQQVCASLNLCSSVQQPRLRGAAAAAVLKAKAKAHRTLRN